MGKLAILFTILSDSNATAGVNLEGEMVLKRALSPSLFHPRPPIAGWGKEQAYYSSHLFCPHSCSVGQGSLNCSSDAFHLLHIHQHCAGWRPRACGYSSLPPLYKGHQFVAFPAHFVWDWPNRGQPFKTSAHWNVLANPPLCSTKDRFIQTPKNHYTGTRASNSTFCILVKAKKWPQEAAQKQGKRVAHFLT